MWVMHNKLMIELKCDFWYLGSSFTLKLYVAISITCALWMASVNCKFYLSTIHWQWVLHEKQYKLYRNLYVLSESRVCSTFLKGWHRKNSQPNILLATNELNLCSNIQMDLHIHIQYTYVGLFIWKWLF